MARCRVVTRNAVSGRNAIHTGNRTARSLTHQPKMSIRRSRGKYDEYSVAIFVQYPAGRRTIAVQARGANHHGLAAFPYGGHSCSSGPLWTALLLYGGSTLLWVWILSRIPLSQAYPWVALGSIIVPLGARLLFGEMVKPVFWLGAVMIAAGIVVTQIGSTK